MATQTTQDPIDAIELIAEQLETGASADIFYDAAYHKDESNEALIESTQNAMTRGAAMLRELRKQVQNSRDIAIDTATFQHGLFCNTSQYAELIKYVGCGGIIELNDEIITIATRINQMGTGLYAALAAHNVQISMIWAYKIVLPTGEYFAELHARAEEPYSQQTLIDYAALLIWNEVQNEADRAGGNDQWTPELLAKIDAALKRESPSFNEYRPI